MSQNLQFLLWYNFVLRTHNNLASASIEALVSITSASTVVSASQDGAGAAASAAGAAASDNKRPQTSRVANTLSFFCHLVFDDLYSD